MVYTHIAIGNPVTCVTGVTHPIKKNVMYRDKNWKAIKTLMWMMANSYGVSYDNHLINSAPLREMSVKLDISIATLSRILSWLVEEKVIGVFYSTRLIDISAAKDFLKFYGSERLINHYLPSFNIYEMVCLHSLDYKLDWEERELIKSFTKDV